MAHVHTFTDLYGAQRVTSYPEECDYPDLHPAQENPSDVQAVANVRDAEQDH
jgi:hypothetical protein